MPEVFECPQCERQFVFELVEPNSDQSIYCPQCKRYLGEKLCAERAGENAGEIGDEDAFERTMWTLHR